MLVPFFLYCLSKLQKSCDRNKAGNKEYEVVFLEIFFFLERLISKQAINTKLKHYSCKNCNKEYEELPAQIE